jgi:predicted transcriptional regulator
MRGSTQDGSWSTRRQEMPSLLPEIDKNTTYTQKEVADLLGISQSYISRLEKKIMQRLKREMVRYES